MSPKSIAFDTRAATAAALAGLIAAALLLAGCAGETPQVRPAGEDVSGTTVRAAAAALPVLVTATGSVEPETRVNLSTRMMGWVRTLHAREGDRVTAGKPLVTIDDADLKAKQAQVEAGIAEARAVTANAEKTAERFESLYAEKSVSRQQLDDVLTGRDRARAGLATALAAREELAVHMGYLDIVAPIDGVVARLMVEEGDMASPGMPLMVLERIERMKIVARLGERDIAQVAVGDTVTADVTSLPGSVHRAVVDRIVPGANPGSRTYDVEMHVDNADGRMRSGMFARVLIPVGERSGVVIPAAAVRERGQLYGVFVVGEDDRVELRWVRPGRETEAGLEVLSGLTAGERVVVSSARPLVEGDRVVN